MQNEHELVNEVAKELFVRAIASGTAGGDATQVAKTAFDCAEAFAEVASKRPGNEMDFRAFTS